MENEDMTCRPLAPEDIQPGQYVAVLHVVAELLAPPWERDSAESATRLIRVQCLPFHASVPVQVQDVCLPFVFVKTAKGKHRTVDVRRYRLARVSNRFGRRVFEQQEADKKAEKTEEAEEKTKSAKDD